MFTFSHSQATYDTEKIILKIITISTSFYKLFNTRICTQNLQFDTLGLFSKKASITNGYVLFTQTVIMVYIRMLLEKPNQTSSILGITKCYSIIYNIKQLTRKSADSSTVHLIKICYLIGVVWGHRTLIHLGNPSFNREGVEMVGWFFPHFLFVGCEIAVLSQVCHLLVILEFDFCRPQSLKTTFHWIYEPYSSSIFLLSWVDSSVITTILQKSRNWD